MKKTAKILSVLLALTLLCTGLVFAVFAESGNAVRVTHSDGTSVEYATYDEAWNNLRTGDTITLLKDATSANHPLDAGIELTVDLNGFTLDGSDSGSFLFNVSGTLNIVGEGKIISSGTSSMGIAFIDVDRPDDKVFVDGEKMGIDVIGAGSSNVAFYAKSGEISLNNVNVSYNLSGTSSEGLIKAEGEGSINLYNCEVYCMVGTTVIVGGNGKVNAKFSGFTAGGYDPDVAGTCTALLLDEAKGGISTATFDHCTLIARSAVYKNSQLLVTSPKSKEDLAHGKVDFTDCTLFTNWRLLVGRKYTEYTSSGLEGKVDPRETTFSFINCNLAASKIHLNEANSLGEEKSLGDDHSIIRSNNTVYMAGTSIKTSNEVGYFDAPKVDGVATITFGEGMKLGENSPSNVKYESDDLKLHINPFYDSGKTQYKYILSATEPTYDYTGVIDLDFDTLFLYTVAQDGSASIPGYGHHFTTGVAARTGSVSTGTNRFDNNNYYKFSTVYEKLPSSSADQFMSINIGWKAAETSYVVWEMDYMTETVPSVDLSMYLCHTGKANSSSSAQTSDNGYGKLIVKQSSDGKYYFEFCQINVNSFDFTPGEWAHITVVARYTPDSNGGFVVKNLLYLNDELAAEYDGNTYLSNRKIDLTIGSLRLHHTKSGTVDPNATDCFDNIRIRRYAAGYNGSNVTDLYDANDKGVTTLPNNGNFTYYTTERPLSNIVARIEDKYYDSLEKAVADANGEKTITLVADYDGTYCVSEPMVIDTNGYSIKFSTLAGTQGYYRASLVGTVQTWSKPTSIRQVSSIVNWHYDPANTDQTEQAMFPRGTYIEYNGTKTSSIQFDAEGYMITVVGWSTEPGGEALTDLGVAEQSGDVHFYAVFARTSQALYTGTLNGEFVYGMSYDELRSLLNGNSNATIYAKLHRDINVYSFNIPIASGAVAELDLNGRSITASFKANMFESGENAKFSLYSSSGESRIFFKTVDATTPDNHHKGAPLINNNKDGAEVIIGAKDHDGTYAGNLYYSGACLIDTSTGLNTTYVIGGTYVRSVNDYSGFVITRSTNNIIIKDATISSYVHDRNIFQLDSGNARGDVTVDNCTIIGTNNAVVGALDAGNTLTFKNTTFYNCILNGNERLTYDVGCKADKIFTNYVANGAKVIETDKQTTLTYRYNAYGDSVNFDASTFNYEIFEEQINTKMLYTIVDEAYEVNNLNNVLYSLTIHNDFVIKVYVPTVATEFIRISNEIGEDLLANASTTVLEDDGNEYYVFNVPVTALEVGNSYAFRFTLDDGVNSVAVKEVSVEKYLTQILNDGAQSVASKQLMMAAANYANEAYKLLNGNENTAMVAILANADYQQYMPQANTDLGQLYDTTALSAAIRQAQLQLDAHPNLVFTTQKGFVGTITISYELAGQQVSKTYRITPVASAKEVVYINFEELKAYQLNQTITITAVGTVGDDAVEVSGQYSLGTYIQNLESNATNADFARALSTFATCAEAYLLSE